MRLIFLCAYMHSLKNRVFQTALNPYSKHLSSLTLRAEAREKAYAELKWVGVNFKFTLDHFKRRITVFFQWAIGLLIANSRVYSTFIALFMILLCLRNLFELMFWLIFRLTFLRVIGLEHYARAEHWLCVLTRS